MAPPKPFFIIAFIKPKIHLFKYIPQQYNVDEHTKQWPYKYKPSRRSHASFTGKEGPVVFRSALQSQNAVTGYLNSEQILSSALHGSSVLANTTHLPNVLSMLAHRLRRWPNIGQTLGRCVVLLGSHSVCQPKYSYTWKDCLQDHTPSQGAHKIAWVGPLGYAGPVFQ